MVREVGGPWHVFAPDRVFGHDLRSAKAGNTHNGDNGDNVPCTTLSTPQGGPFKVCITQLSAHWVRHRPVSFCSQKRQAQCTMQSTMSRYTGSKPGSAYRRGPSSNTSAAMRPAGERTSASWFPAAVVMCQLPRTDRRAPDAAASLIESGVRLGCRPACMRIHGLKPECHGGLT